MGAWRFYNNPRIELPELAVPLREYVRRHLSESLPDVVLLVHDWCKLSYPGHKSKRDQAELTEGNNRGYELTTVLAVSGENGAPLAPMEIHLKTGNGVLSTRDQVPPDVHHLEQVLPSMEASRTWNLGCQALHVIDREADSVGHFRAWHAAKHYFLVRGHGHRVVTWEGRALSREKIAKELQNRGELRLAGSALYHGRRAALWVAETSVVLAQPARTMVGKRQVSIPGPPLPLRLIVVQVRDEEGRVLATWYLLTNAPADWLSAEHLARCYYWRWRIETYFKLLKSHGMQLEHWLQETGAAIARRLLVASMACVTVWSLLDDPSPAAMTLKTILVRFSGRQTKRNRPHTAPALLAGLWSVLTMLNYLEHSDLDDLKQLIADVGLPFPTLDSG
ncbi:MAG: IS4-like element ISRba2 family transposase [Candidatus Acidiferrum sp.]